jgi:site-specific recombinase XerC
MTTNPDEYETHHEEYLQKQKDIVSEELRSEHSGKVLDFLYDRDEDLAPSTARNYARELRFLIKYTYDNDGFEPEPEEWTSNDWNRLIRRVSRERGIGDGTKRNTCYAARAFVHWLVETPADKSEIDAPSTTHEKVDKETVLKPGEVVSLIEATRTARDAAVIAVMYEAALRRTALVQLDVKHYQEDPFARIEVPQKVGVKTGGGRERPISWSQGYLDNWMSQHPNADDPDAPLFCSIRDRDNHSRLSSHAIYTMMQRTGERTDIDSERINPHALRHARATEMRKSDQFGKNDIELVLGWADSTPMHARYEHATSMEEATRTAQKMGIEIGGDDEKQIQDCPRCDTKLPPQSRYCPTCTLKIDGKAPEWWQLFDAVCKDTDPVKKRYGALPSAVPELHDLSPQELDHIQNVYLIAEQQMYDHNSDIEIEQHPYDDVGEFETEEEANSAMEIVREVQNQLASIYEDSPYEFDFIDSVDEVELEAYLETKKAEEDE